MAWQPLSLATLGHPRPDMDGDIALATEDKRSHVVRLVATVLYTSSLKDHQLKIDFIVSGELCSFNWPFIPYNEKLDNIYTV